jgi:hypothetical protein
MKRFLAVLVVAAGLLGACNTARVLTVRDAPIGLAAQGRDVPAIIEHALVERGWQVAARRPGSIDAFIMVREHRADITVSYDADSYSIAYRDSENLNHSGNNIHRNYNRWVANLNTDIQRGLAAASVTP